MLQVLVFFLILFMTGGDAAAPSKRKSKAKSKSLKSRLLADLRAKRKEYKSKLKAINRDYRSISGRRKK